MYPLLFGTTYGCLQAELPDSPGFSPEVELVLQEDQMQSFAPPLLAIFWTQMLVPSCQSLFWPQRVLVPKSGRDPGRWPGPAAEKSSICLRDEHKSVSSLCSFAELQVQKHRQLHRSVHNMPKRAHQGRVYSP